MMSEAQTGHVCEWEGCESEATTHLLYYAAAEGEATDPEDSAIHSDLCAEHIEAVFQRHGKLGERELGNCADCIPDSGRGKPARRAGHLQ
jgi:hypothetical protein